MKVCVVVDTYPGMHALWSGAERMGQRLGEGLSAAGHTVRFLTRPPDAGFARAAGTVCARQGLAGAGWLTRHLPLDAVAMGSVLGQLRRLRPDVVHSFAKDLHFPTLAACGVLGVPLVFTVVDQYLFCPTQTLALPGGQVCDARAGGVCERCFELVEGNIRNAVARRLARRSGAVRAFLELRARLAAWGARRLDAVIVLSEASRKRVLELGVAGERTHRIYLYDVATPTTPAEPFPEPTVVYVGALSAARGADVAVRVMARVAARAPRARLKMVGAVWDDYGRMVCQLPARLGIADRVEFLGALPNAETLDVIRRSRVVLTPLQFPNEFGPMNLVEAMRMGRPVVASRIGATPEFVRDGVDGILAAPDDVEGMASGVARLLEDRALAEAMGAAARRRTDSLAPEGYLREALKVYEGLLTARGRR